MTTCNACGQAVPELGQPREPLTERQREVLEFIRSFIVQNGMAPTLREIGAGLGIGSTNGVSEHLWALEKKGAIAQSVNGKGLGLARSIRVLVGPE